jgi:hypothetical protein
MQQPKKYGMLAKSFLNSSLTVLLFLTILLIICACGKLPEVVHQLDTKHGVANPFKILKYDERKCEVKVQEMEPIPLMGPEMHGAFCLTRQEFAKYKASLKAECLNKRHEQKHYGP